MVSELPILDMAKDTRSHELERCMEETFHELEARSKEWERQHEAIRIRSEARFEELTQLIRAISIQNTSRSAAMESSVAAIGENGESAVEEEDQFADFRNLKQVSTLRYYIAAFDELYRIIEIEEDQAVSLFLSGLVEELRFSVRRFNPKTLNDAYALSKLQYFTLTGKLPMFEDDEFTKKGRPPVEVEKGMEQQEKTINVECDDKELEPDPHDVGEVEELYVVEEKGVGNMEGFTALHYAVPKEPNSGIVVDKSPLASFAIGAVEILFPETKGLTHYPNWTIQGTIESFHCEAVEEVLSLQKKLEHEEQTNVEEARYGYKGVKNVEIGEFLVTDDEQNPKEDVDEVEEKLDVDNNESGLNARREVVPPTGGFPSCP